MKIMALYRQKKRERLQARLELDRERRRTLMARTAYLDPDTEQENNIPVKFALAVYSILHNQAEQEHWITVDQSVHRQYLECFWPAECYSALSSGSS